MSNDGRAVANLILDLVEDEGRGITNLSLQKLVYFCHAWSLVQLKVPLVKHRFEAWQYGPVLQYLYRDFKSFDREPITSRAKKLNPISGEYEVVSAKLDSQSEELVKKAVRFYGRLSAGTLVELSHTEGGPWHTVWNHQGTVNPGMTIADESIREYFSNIRAPF